MIQIKHTQAMLRNDSLSLQEELLIGGTGNEGKLKRKSLWYGALGAVLVIVLLHVLGVTLLRSQGYEFSIVKIGDGDGDLSRSVLAECCF